MSLLLLFHGLPTPVAAGGGGPQIFTQDIDETLDLLDDYFRRQDANLNEPALAQDALTKTLSKVLDDAHDVFDQLIRSRTLNLDERAAIDDAVAKALAKVLADDQATFDQLSKSLAVNMTELAAAVDEITKSRSLNLDERADISDSVTFALIVIALLTLAVDDTVDLADNYIRSQSGNLDEAAAAQDALTKSLSVSLTEALAAFDQFAKSLGINLNDRADVSDSVTLDKYVILALADSLDLLDNYIRSQFGNLSDSAGAQDAVVKSLLKTVDDAETASEVLEKLLAYTLADRFDLVDSLTTLRTIVFSDVATVLDDYLRLQGLNLADSGIAQDAVVKAIAKLLTDDVALDDSSVFNKFTQLVFADVLDLLDDYRRSQTGNIDDALRGDDAIVKTLSKVMNEDRQDVSDAVDTVKVISLLLLEVLDFVDLLDEFTKRLFVERAEPGAVADSSQALISKTNTDTVAVSDTVTLDKAIILVLTEVQAVLDGLTRLQSANLDEPTLAGDEFTKTLAKSLTDLLDARDEVQKLLSISVSDRLDIADSVSFLRQVSALLSDILDIADGMVQSRTANMDERSGVLDEFTKVLSTTIAERLDLLDQLLISKFTQLVLSEIQAVADDMVKALAAVMEDSTVNEDALVKLVAKVIDERQDFSDSVLLEVVYAIIIIAEYLDTRLSARHDLVRRLGGVNQLTEKISKVVDKMGRKPGTKGHVR